MEQLLFKILPELGMEMIGTSSFVVVVVVVPPFQVVFRPVAADAETPNMSEDPAPVTCICRGMP